ncbi:hypothetical protein [Streptomyces sp. NPDC095817]
MDFSFLSVLAAACLHAGTAGGWLRLAALAQSVQRVVDIVGL